MKNHEKKCSLITLVLTIALTAFLVGLGAYLFFTEQIRFITESSVGFERSKEKIERQKESLNEQEEQTLTDYNLDELDLTFSYPKNLQIKEYNEGTLTVGFISGSGIDELVDGLVEIRVIKAEEEDTNMDFQEFIMEKIPLFCDADGAGVSISCPKKINEEELATLGGLTGYTITMNQKEESFGPNAFVENSDRTFYAVMFEEDPIIAFIVYPTNESSAEIAKNIAASLR